MTDVSTQKQETKKTNRLYTLLTVLAFLLVLQTAFVVYLLFRETAPEKPVEAGTEKAALPAEADPHPFPLGKPAPSYGSWLGDDPFFADDPWSQLGRMRQRMDRLMDSFAAGAFGGRMGGMVTPSVDFQETDDAYIMTSDLPGLEKDKINVTVRGNTVTLQGVREQASEAGDDSHGFHARERFYGSFSRTVTLPGPVDETAVTANYKEGVLTVILPKAGEDAAEGRIRVQ